MSYLQVSTKCAKTWCESKNIFTYFETSANDGKNVEIAFQTVAKNVLAREIYDEPILEVPITLKIEEDKKRSSC